MGGLWHPQTANTVSGGVVAPVDPSLAVRALETDGYSVSVAYLGVKPLSPVQMPAAAPHPSGFHPEIRVTKGQC